MPPCQEARRNCANYFSSLNAWDHSLRTKTQRIRRGHAPYRPNNQVRLRSRFCKAANPRLGILCRPTFQFRRFAHTYHHGMTTLEKAARKRLRNIT
jgi:hypothetical protein